MVGEVWRRMGRDDVLILASATAYAAVLSVFPLLVAAIALLGLFVEQAAAQETVIRAMRPYLPDQALVLVRDTLQGIVQTRGAAGVISAVGLFWGATALTGSLRQGLNRVLGGTPRAFWRLKLVDLGMVILGGVFLSLSVLGSAVLAVLSVRPVAAIVERAAGTLGQFAAQTLVLPFQPLAIIGASVMTVPLLGLYFVSFLVVYVAAPRDRTPEQGRP